MHIDIGFNYRKFPEFRDKEEELRYHQLWANKLPPDDAPKVARTLKLSEDADDTLDSQQPESCATGSGAAIQRKVVYQAGRRFVWVVPVFPSWNPWSTANRDNTVLEKDPTRRTCTVQIHKALADLQPGFDQLPDADPPLNNFAPELRLFASLVEPLALKATVAISEDVLFETVKLALTQQWGPTLWGYLKEIPAPSQLPTDNRERPKEQQSYGPCNGFPFTYNGENFDLGISTEGRGISAGNNSSSNSQSVTTGPKKSER